METPYLAVGRFRKPHGLKGEALVQPMTDEPQDVFVPERVLVPVDDEAQPIGDEVVLARARMFGRQWLLSFVGIEDRATLERWPPWLLGARSQDLRPPSDNEMYLHEVPGAVVVNGTDRIGVAREVVGPNGAELLVVECDGREHLIPFRPPIVERLERANRRIHVRLPPGLLEI